MRVRHQKNLAISILNYGAQAQLQFNYNTDNLANSVIQNPSIPEDVTIPSDYAEKTIERIDNAVADLYQETLSLDGATSMRVYYTLDGDSAVDNLHFVFEDNGVVNTSELSYSSKYNMYYGVIPNITSVDLDKMYTVYLVYTNDLDTNVTNKVQCGPMSVLLKRLNYHTM